MAGVNSVVGWVFALMAAALPPSASWAGSAEEALTSGVELPTGQAITPAAARGAIFQDLNPGQQAAPQMRAGQAATLAVAPDGRTLAILTSGFNLYYDKDGKVDPNLSKEYVFLFDITGGVPKQIQALPLTNTFEGLAWTPSSDRFFVSGGSDDTVFEFVRDGATFAAGRAFHLGHQECVGLSLPSQPLYWINPPNSPPPVISRKCGPMTGSLSVSPDGKQLLVANLQNDSVSLIDVETGRIVTEQDLRPGKIDPKHRGQPGGTYPRSVVWISADRAYVASERDREIISLRILGSHIRVMRRMPVLGQPMALATNRRGSRLYVALDTTSRVAIFDTVHDALIESFDAVAPASVYESGKIWGGANTDALTLTPDEHTLLVSNGGQNSVAVVRLSDRARGQQTPLGGDDDDDKEASVMVSKVVGLVPTGRYPTGVATSKDGAMWYIINYKSETAPNVRWCSQYDLTGTACIPEGPVSRSADKKVVLDPKTAGLIRSQNMFSLAIEKAGFLTMPAPTPLELARLTKQVARNNHFDRPESAAADDKIFGFLREHIKHVIYIVKENKTYDELFGDLGVGNGDPRLVFFPNRITPNHHALARQFVAVDNFLVAGSGSWTGWEWSTAAQVNDYRDRSETLASTIGSQAGGMFKFDAGFQGEPGIDRNLNMAYATNAERKKYDPLTPSDADILAGAHDVAASDGPGGKEAEGYLWAAALHKGRTVRNWGFFGGFFPNQWQALIRDPHATKTRVFFPVRPGIMSFSDPYYYSFDPAMPDYWRFQEWRREFATFAAKKVAPQLMLVQLTNDHTGDFVRAIDGVNTPDTQIADNDYALGLLVETVAQSPFAKDTLIMVIEDDPASGLDHVDAFRSIALFAGPYVRQHAVVSKRYTTISVVKTIEEVLGLDPIGLNDALAAPMSEVFDPQVTTWSYKSIVPDVLRSTELPLPASAGAKVAAPRRSAAYWAKAMAGQDFTQPDRIDPQTYTVALWRGLMGDRPFPGRAKMRLEDARDR